MPKNIHKNIFLPLAVAFLLLTSGIKAAEIADFKLEAYFVQEVGKPFPLTVKNAVDRFGNKASGVVQVLIKDGDGVSPDSFPPILNPITVSNGEGSAFQVLTTSGATIFLGKVDTVERSSNVVFTQPADLHHFDLVIPSPQTSGVPFTSPSVLRAEDLYGNAIVSFDAGTDTVRILPDVSGSMQNNIFNKTSDFDLGIANPSAKQTTYTGKGGFVVFTARSKSGKTGQSQPIWIRSLNVSNLNVEATSLERGDTLEALVEILNTADVTAQITDLKLILSLGNLLNQVVSPSLPNNLPGNLSRIYNVKVRIPNNYSSGWLHIGAKVSGKFDGYTVSDSSLNLDSVLIKSAADIVYQQNSLTPSLIFAERPVSFEVKIYNTGGSDVILDQTSRVALLDDGSEFVSAFLPTGLVIPAQSDTITLEFFGNAPLPTPVGFYPAYLILKGQEGEAAFSDSILVSDSVYLESLSNLAFDFESFSPDTIRAGDNTVFKIKFRNSSIWDLQLTNLTRLTFSLLETDVDLGKVAIVKPGETTLFFRHLVYPVNYPWGDFGLTLYLNGNLRGVNVSDTFSKNEAGNITVLPPINSQVLEAQVSFENPNKENPFILTEGEELRFQLILKNEDFNTGHSILLNRIAILFKDQNDDFISPQELIPIGIPEDCDPIIPGNKLIFRGDTLIFTPTRILLPQEKYIPTIQLCLKEGFFKPFKLAMGTWSLSAYDYFNNQIGPPVPVVTPTGEPFSYESPFFTILTGSFAQSISNFPNPFNPDKEGCQIIYNLNSSSPVTCKIFTLTGDLVNTFEIPAGQTSFTWNGKNKDGRTVQSGVYLGWLKVKNSNEEVKIKIAVMK
ncbi:MAG TPA: FlgD immunoglobulin-like domain containing protein [candidate division Zixibacteria bacterium]|nr:FlgD immunoglobulin-like domain containing protein [candidate division Zixibacteria bacterium]